MASDQNATVAIFALNKNDDEDYKWINQKNFDAGPIVQI